MTNEEIAVRLETIEAQNIVLVELLQKQSDHLKAVLHWNWVLTGQNEQLAAAVGIQAVEERPAMNS